MHEVIWSGGTVRDPRYTVFYGRDKSLMQSDLGDQTDSLKKAMRIARRHARRGRYVEVVDNYPDDDNIRADGDSTGAA